MPQPYTHPAMYQLNVFPLLIFISSNRSHKIDLRHTVLEKGKERRGNENQGRRERERERERE